MFSVVYSFQGILCCSSWWVDRVAMSKGGQKEMWVDPPWFRTRLCYAIGDASHNRKECNYAHSLRELQAPDESRAFRNDLWRNFGVDRFYGQRLSGEQKQKLLALFDDTPPNERPVWSVGLYLLHHEREHYCGFCYEWDFGLLCDMHTLSKIRRYPNNFDLYPGLRERLDFRRQAMIHYDLPPHAPLGYLLPVCPSALQERYDAMKSEYHEELKKEKNKRPASMRSDGNALALVPYR